MESKELSPYIVNATKVPAGVQVVCRDRLGRESAEIVRSTSDPEFAVRQVLLRYCSESEIAEGVLCVESAGNVSWSYPNSEERRVDGEAWHVRLSCQQIDRWETRSLSRFDRDTILFFCGVNEQPLSCQDEYQVVRALDRNLDA